MFSTGSSNAQEEPGGCFRRSRNGHKEVARDSKGTLANQCPTVPLHASAWINHRQVVKNHRLGKIQQEHAGE